MAQCQGAPNTALWFIGPRRLAPLTRTAFYAVRATDFSIYIYMSFAAADVHRNAVQASPPPPLLVDDPQTSTRL